MNRTSRTPQSPARPRRKGLVLLTVLFIIVIASLIGTSVLYIADAQRGSASLNLEQAQLRSLAWSGVQATMAELDGQRSTLLKGEKPTVTNSWKLWEGTAGGSITLAVIGPEGATLTSEASRLDLNLATAEMLAKLPGVGEEAATKITAARGRGFGAPEEIGRIDGLTASVLHDAPPDDQPSAAPTGPRGLLTQTTVFAFDPNFDETGEAKINISNGWTDELREPLAHRLGEELAKTFEPALKSAGKLASDADLIDLLRRLKLPQAQWDVALAAITTSDEEFSRGKVDINQASVEVLATLPGIDRPTAEKLVDARARLGTEDRQKVTWPLTQGVMKDEDFQKAAAWLTTRSLQWRVRVEARLERAQSRSDSLGSTTRDKVAASETLDPPGMVWEAVIDVSDTRRPRVAYLRDVTHLPGLVRQALAQESAAETSSVTGVEPPSDLQSGTHTPGPASVSDLAENESTKSNAKLNTKSMKGQSLKLGTGLNLKSGSSNEQRSEDAASPAVEVEPKGGTPPPVSKDRRIGRWRGNAKE